MFKRFKELRVSSCISVESLAAEINVLPELINDIENGSAEPPLFILVLYANYFHVTADYLLELTEDRNGYSDTPF